MSTKQTTVKSKLFKLREWLTMPDAARHLSIMFGEEVNEADVLRLALDGHLRLSVNFVNRAYGKCGRLISCEDKENLPSDFLSLFANCPEDMKDAHINGFIKMGHFENQFLDLDDKVTAIEGVWDLPMVCGQRYGIEHKYQMLTGGPEVPSPIIGAAFVVREGGQICRIHEKFDEPLEYKIAQGEKKIVNFENESDRYYPAAADDFPNDDSVLVVRTQALIDLQEKLTSEESTGEPTLNANTDLPLLDTGHAFYANELKIAVEAWTKLYSDNPPQHTPKGGHKKYISKWLEENYSSLSDRAHNRIATIVNPNSKGGASPIE